MPVHFASLLEHKGGNAFCSHVCEINIYIISRFKMVLQLGLMCGPKGYSGMCETLISVILRYVYINFA